MMLIYSKKYDSALLILCFLFLIQCPLRGDSQNTQLSVTSGTDFIASLGSIVLQNTDIKNNGTFDASKANVAFTGSSSSSISGNDSVLINEFTLNKTGGAAEVTLNAEVHVNNRVNFISGLINLNGVIFLLTDSAFLNNESETSRITGTTGSLVVANLADVNNPLDLNIANLGAVITSIQNLGNVKISRSYQPAQNPVTGFTGIQRTFLIQPTNDISLNAVLRFYYFDAELNNKDENTLSLWTSADGVTWTNAGITSRNTTNNYVEKIGLTSLSYFTLSDANNALPVTLVSFNASCKNNYALIEWKTATEISTSHFDIEKSDNGINWNVIQSVVAANKINGNSYSYEDNNPFPTAYYRIKIVDMSGAFYYSPVFSGGCTDIAMPFVVYPNPTDNNAVARISVRQPTEAIIQLFDITGRQIYTSKWSLQVGNNQFLLPVQSLIANAYIVKVLIGKTVLQTKFIKQ
ncbi:MAG TPA: T9SS type A sorting domain-containing protein [Hanamia sp.]|nr:T9SS type A sorting domain-containing protein [Hanamia sp.]